jgi:hypothetical protein
MGVARGFDHDPKTLFAQSEAQQRSTRWLRGLPIDCDTNFNLLAAEYSPLPSK